MEVSMMPIGSIQRIVSEIRPGAPVSGEALTAMRTAHLFSGEGIYLAHGPELNFLEPLKKDKFAMDFPWFISNDGNNFHQLVNYPMEHGSVIGSGKKYVEAKKELTAGGITKFSLHAAIRFEDTAFQGAAILRYIPRLFLTSPDSLSYLQPGIRLSLLPETESIDLLSKAAFYAVNESFI